MVYYMRDIQKKYYFFRDFLKIGFLTLETCYFSGFLWCYSGIKAGLFFVLCRGGGALSGGLSVVVSVCRVVVSL